MLATGRGLVKDWKTRAPWAIRAPVRPGNERGEAGGGLPSDTHSGQFQSLALGHDAHAGLEPLAPQAGAVSLFALSEPALRA